MVESGHLTLWQVLQDMNIICTKFEDGLSMILHWCRSSWQSNIVVSGSHHQCGVDFGNNI